jgi:hypothetical protein
VKFGAALTGRSGPQVVPSQVEVPRCAGTCHRPGLPHYQRCVPGTVSNTRCSCRERDEPVGSLLVLYERLEPGAGVVERCGTVLVATHIDCRWGITWTPISDSLTPTIAGTPLHPDT